MLKRTLLYLMCFLLVLISTAYGANEYVEVSAESAVVIDAATKAILYEKNAFSYHAMASTTKIMTCLLACESDDLMDEVTITQEMLAGVEGSAIYIKAGDKITLLDLVKGALLASGNDAANAIAVYLGGSLEEFATLMNKKAAELEMQSSLFVTPSGLDEGDHHSTAYDMALLAAYAMKNVTFASIVKMQSAEISINGTKQTVYNHNKLLARDEGFVGVKTGYTKKAGRCLVSAYSYKGSQIICVTMHAPDDWNDHTKLVEYAKKQYNTTNGSDKININIVGANSQYVSCSYDYTVAAYGSVWVKLYYYPIVYAPIHRGDKIGFVEIYSGDAVIDTASLTADEEVELTGDSEMLSRDNIFR